jgi:hypothetical protein
MCVTLPSVWGLEQLEDIRLRLFGKDRQALAAISQRVEQVSGSKPGEPSGDTAVNPEASGSIPADPLSASPRASESNPADAISASPRVADSVPSDVIPGSPRGSTAGSRGPGSHAGPPDLLGFGVGQISVLGTPGQAEDVLVLVQQAKTVLQAQGVWPAVVHEN